MAWSDLASNECPTKADINARFREYLLWQSRSVSFSSTNYTVNPGGAPWNYLFVYVKNIGVSPMQFAMPSSLLIPKADNGGVITYTMKFYPPNNSSPYDTVSISFNGTTGDITFKKGRSFLTEFNYIVFL
ncbi:hypothetical protein [Bacteroides uniformis]|uniref:hypothetical protein n=1 Tax=Bacteroides uniformis TaxID=820 RepID=UPI00232B7FB1|nr:hypothetical protein [Bacteroides uniformis]MDC1820303.1 hypothetical protein [Bacteroides uniformis]